MLTKITKAVTKGAATESMALKYLEKQGLTFVEKNFRIKQGELDLVMMDSGTLVFIEVRYRKSSSYGTPEETVTVQKQKKLLQAAAAYLQTNGLTDRYPCRFDVVAITPIEQKPSFNWHKNAFSAF